VPPHRSSAPVSAGTAPRPRWSHQISRRAFDPWRVAVEIDGVHHLEAGQSWDDAQRQNALVLDGYVVLRCPARVVREFPDRARGCVDQGGSVRAGWRLERVRLLLLGEQETYTGATSRQRAR
jgi:hypothetical protein